MFFFFSNFNRQAFDHSMKSPEAIAPPDILAQPRTFVWDDSHILTLGGCDTKRVPPPPLLDSEVW